MTVLSAQTIQALQPVEPFCQRTRHNGVTFGLGPAGYDVRVAEKLVLLPGQFVLASTVERFNMPGAVLAVVHDKSTWARRGLFVQNTVIEPGWRGFLTLEITYHGPPRLPDRGQTPPAVPIYVEAGSGIAQIVFHQLDHRTALPYEGKYQDQQAGPQTAILEGSPPPSGRHHLYQTGDADAPDAIKDRNGEVVLGLCRRCGMGEAELGEFCHAEG